MDIFSVEKKTVPRIGGNSLRKIVQRKITHTAFPDSKEKCHPLEEDQMPFD